jgi:hypothetical protein
MALKPIPDMTIEELRTEVKSHRLAAIRRSHSTPVEIMDKFELFYKLYPRKVQRKNAIKAWSRMYKEKMFSDGLFEIIIEAVKAQSEWGGSLCPKEDGNKSYIPHPASWLNGENWTDEVDEIVLTEPVASEAVSEAQGEELWQK